MRLVQLAGAPDYITERTCICLRAYLTVDWSYPHFCPRAQRPPFHDEQPANQNENKYYLIFMISYETKYYKYYQVFYYTKIKFINYEENFEFLKNTKNQNWKSDVRYLHMSLLPPPPDQIFLGIKICSFNLTLFEQFSRGKDRTPLFLVSILCFVFKNTNFALKMIFVIF